MARTKATAPKVASLDSEDLATGLPDDFDAVITGARFCAHTFGEREKDLMARLTFAAEGFDEPIEQYFSAGKLEFFSPSLDGETPIDADEDDTDGYFALQVGRRDKLSGSCNFGLFLASMRASGLPKGEATGDIRSLEGIKGHFNRLDQPKRSGIIVDAEEDEGKTYQYLAMTDYLGRDEGVAKAGGKRAAKAGGKKRTRKGAGDTATAAAFTDDTLAKVVHAAAVKAGAKEDSDGNAVGVPKSKLPALAMGAFSGKDKAAATKRVTQAEFLSAYPSLWVWEEDDAALYDAALYD